MTEQDRDFQSAHEIGKIYASITDRKVLAAFFLESVSRFVKAEKGYIFLAGRDEQIWLESSTSGEESAASELEKLASVALKEGKPRSEASLLLLPLIVRNGSIGIAVFQKEKEGDTFGQKELDLGFNMTSQMAGVLKNIMLFEENLKMERLAAIGQTIGMVMHEIKNIMQIARLSDEFIKKGLQEDNKKFLNRGIEKMDKALKEMDGFVWDMLGLTKEYHLETELVDVSKVIKELENDLIEKATDLEVKLDFQVEEGFPSVDADGRSLYRALLNLAKNAIEACDKEGALVQVRVKSKDETHYEITVQDNGEGMSDEVKARIFQAFYSTKGSKGTGLGLMIIDRTVKTHQGTIEVQSEAGKGTVFKLTLPKSLKPALSDKK